ncbi:MAG: MarR family transcriptional regulator [Candidatus Sulfotelmatobacter sp.]
MSGVKRKKIAQQEAGSDAMMPPPEAIMPPPETVAAADRLHSAAIHLLRRVRRQDVATGIGPAQLSALSVLVFAGPKTLGELAAAEQIKPPTMSRIVSCLKRSHLIAITRDPHDARCLHIVPTAKGTRLLQQGRQRRIAYLAVRLASLATNELAQISAAAEILEMLLRRWQ